MRANGFNFNFFKSSWSLFRYELEFISEFYLRGKLEKDLNSLFIVLVPKVLWPSLQKEFRPTISLVNSLCEILTKLLANRLKMVISSVISDTESALIGGRQSMAGIFLANEVIHSMKKKYWNTWEVVLNLSFDREDIWLFKLGFI